jgi:hypothetical protein
MTGVNVLMYVTSHARIKCKMAGDYFTSPEGVDASSHTGNRTFSDMTTKVLEMVISNHLVPEINGMVKKKQGAEDVKKAEKKPEPAATGGDDSDEDDDEGMLPPMPTITGFGYLDDVIKQMSMQNNFVSPVNVRNDVIENLSSALYMQVMEPFQCLNWDSLHINCVQDFGIEYAKAIVRYKCEYIPVQYKKSNKND